MTILAIHIERAALGPSPATISAFPHSSVEDVAGNAGRETRSGAARGPRFRCGMMIVGFVVAAAVGAASRASAQVTDARLRDARREPPGPTAFYRYRSPPPLTPTASRS